MTKLRKCSFGSFKNIISLILRFNHAIFNLVDSYLNIRNVFILPERRGILKSHEIRGQISGSDLILKFSLTVFLVPLQLCFRSTCYSYIPIISLIYLIINRLLPRSTTTRTITCSPQDSCSEGILHIVKYFLFVGF